MEAGAGGQRHVAGGLLDTYHAERHPIGAHVLRNTMASVALRGEDGRTKALRETISELFSMDEPRKLFAATMSGLDIHYGLGDGHPLLGRPADRC
jgi:2-polyprenyl-6-methoxyphenol hydroxylase-like FAD-dependent oxidoreductase